MKTMRGGGPENGRKSGANGELGAVFQGEAGDLVYGLLEVDVLDDWMVVASGHGKELVLEDFESIKIPLGEVPILVVGAEGAGFEFVAVWYVEDA